jgi:hypothetical protein
MHVAGMQHQSQFGAQDCVGHVVAPDFDVLKDDAKLLLAY